MCAFSLYKFIEETCRKFEEIQPIEKEIKSSIDQSNATKAAIEKLHKELQEKKRESLSLSHQIEEKEFDIDEFFARENKEKELVDEHISSHVRLLAQKSLQSIQASRLRAEAELESLYNQEEKSSRKFKAEIDLLTEKLQAQENNLIKQIAHCEELKSKCDNLYKEFSTLSKTAPEEVFQRLFFNGDLKKLTVAKVSNQLCSKCFYPVSSLQYNCLLRKDAQLIECKNCFISLYLDQGLSL